MNGLFSRYKKANYKDCEMYFAKNNNAKRINKRNVKRQAYRLMDKDFSKE